MPTPADKASYDRLQQGVQFDTSLKLVSRFPRLPKTLHDRFPELAQYEKEVVDWHMDLLLALKGGDPGLPMVAKLPP
jgi:hypothetical protein